MPVKVQDTQLVDNLVTLEHLDGNDSGVLQLVAGDLAVEDLDGTIVTGIGEERKSASVVPDGANGFAVESHGLVWPGRQIEIVPEQTLVVTTGDQVVTSRMDVKRGYPSDKVSNLLLNHKGGIKATYHFAPG